MTRRRPPLLHFLFAVLLACQSLVASAALPYGCAAQGLQAVAALASAAAAGDAGHDDHCGGTAAAHDAATASAAIGDHDSGDYDSSSGHRATSCHCLHSNGCAMPSDVSVPVGPGATAPEPLSVADRIEPFLPTENRPPISTTAS